jgi:hypothetical protein
MLILVSTLQLYELFIMPVVTAPDFGMLLAEHIGSIPEQAVPAFLARLERTAADRYRMWAEAVPEHAEGLLRCAAREDEIADRAEQIYPATDPQHITAMDNAIGPARDTYYRVFAELTPIEQMTIQANAERQGAAAWRAMIDPEPNQDIQAELEQIAQIEEASADYLDELLKGLAPQ